MSNYKIYLEQIRKALDLKEEVVLYLNDEPYSIFSFDKNHKYVNKFKIGFMKKRFLKKSVFIPIHRFGLAQLVGCCGICVSTSVETYRDYRKKGVNKIALELRKCLAGDWGYGLLMCTYRDYNEAEKKTLAHGGFNNIAFFNNPRTGNDIQVAAYDLMSQTNP